MTKRFFFWTAKSNDCSFTDESRKVFNTQEECYNDMRCAALEKMKWNTEYEDFDGGNTDRNGVTHDKAGGIGYRVQFNPNSIEHSSYSGTYTYEVHACTEWDMQCLVNMRFKGTDDVVNNELAHKLLSKIGKVMDEFQRENEERLFSVRLC